MTPPAKKPASKVPAAKKAASKAAPGSPPSPVLAKALKALSDERVQNLLIANSQAALDAAKAWMSSRRSKPAKPTSRIDVPNPLDRFGQKGLERRAANIDKAVRDLSAKSPALATALKPVAEALSEVDSMLSVSAALPFFKRKRAHLRIDDVVDDLEQALFTATFPGASGSGTD